jgi:LPXTG-site transpeptidase (sortase) family protein
MGLRFRSSKNVASDRLSRLSVFVMALGIAALIAAGVLFGLSATGIVGEGGLRSGPGTVTGFGSYTPSPRTPVPSAPTPSSAAMTRIVIPKAKVDAPLVTLGIDSNGVMESTKNATDVAWYNFSAKPGTDGNAVFSGHVDYHDVGEAVFWNLRDLQPNDVVEIQLDDGTSYNYGVTALNCIPVENAPISEIVGPTQSEVVTLITCCGTFNSSTRQYDKRLVVRAERLYDTTPTPPPALPPS